MASNNRSISRIMACLAAGLAAGPVLAACPAPEARQLDFWVGEWDVAWSVPNGRSGRARNRVMLENDGCTIREQFRDLDGTVEGTAIYGYVAAAGSWFSTWMDSHGTMFTTRGGRPGDGSAAFILNLQRGADPTRQYRILFDEVTADGLVWRFQSRQGEGAWRDETVSRYRRRPAVSLNGASRATLAPASLRHE